MKRREFLLNSAAGAAGISLFPSLLTACNRAHDPLHDIGIITNVVQEIIAEDPRGTMRMLAEMGYKYLEFGGTWGEKAGDLKLFMKEIGLTPLAGGTNLAGLQGDGLEQVIDDCLAMDKKYLICYWPWMDGGENPTWDQVKFATDDFLRIGERCNENGLRFAFHNHEKEFIKLDGEVFYDYILQNTPPELVAMQVDLYWAHKGGADIREYFKKYPGRFELVHLKDSYDSPDLRSFACVGSGIIDFQDLLSYRNVAGFKHLIVEHDKPEHEEECARSSIDYIRTLQF